jgi:ABC-type antimicrobial peptide transport system permease subunit
MLGTENKKVYKYLWADGIILLILSIPFGIVSTFIYFNVIGLIMQMTAMDFSLHIVNYLSVIIGGIIMSMIIVISPRTAYRLQTIFSVIKKKKKKVLINDHT